MTRRKRTPTDVETEVLQASARRCAICFGLNNDFSVRKGQIAHLDQNPANTAIDNLAWLCFEHHDEYDSSTRQSKGLTVGEVKAYRERLRHVVSQSRQIPLSFLPESSPTSLSSVIFEPLTPHESLNLEYSKEEIIQIGDIVVEKKLGFGAVSVRGQPVILTEKEYDFLLILVKHVNRLVPLDRIGSVLYDDKTSPVSYPIAVTRIWEELLSKIGTETPRFGRYANCYFISTLG